MDSVARHRRLQAEFDSLSDLASVEREAALCALATEDAELAEHLGRLLARDTETYQPLAASSLLLSALDHGFGSGRPAAEIGDFRVLDRIGAGGMGEVFLGERKRGEVLQRAAIKLIHRGLLGPEALRRFSIEQRALARLEHPGIARWLDAGTLADGTPWYAMEYVAGDSLTRYCDDQRLGVDQRVALFLEVCRTVQFAHSCLVLHRDLKPGNILVSATGQTKLLDFGIAKLLSDNDVDAPQRTATTGGFVSAHYSAPEMYTAAGVSVAADVYSLCAMLYELLAGVPALVRTGESSAEFETRVLHEMPLPPSVRVVAEGRVDNRTSSARRLSGAQQLASRLRGDLDRIVLHGLRKLASERYGSVAQLIDDLERWQNGEPVLARGAGTAYRLGKFLRRHWALSSLAAVLAATVAAALVALSLQAGQLRRERDLAQLERDRAEYAVDLLRDAFLAADPAQSADGDASVRDVLEAARERLESLIVPQPEMYLKLAETIGEVEIAIGMEDRAAELLTRAAAHARVTGATADVVTRLSVRSAWALVGADEPDAAEQALSGGVPEPENLRTLWYAARARLDRLLKRYEEAERGARLAVAGLPTSGLDDVLILQIRNLLADVLRSRAHYSKALTEIDSTLAWQRSRPGITPAALLRTRLHRIDVVRWVQPLDVVLIEAADINARVQEIYGADSLFAATASSSLGSTLVQLQRYAEAQKHYRVALSAYRALLGDRHINTIRSQFNLALVLARIDGAAVEAELLFKTAIASIDDSGESGVGGRVFYRHGYAEFLLMQSRPIEALELLADAGAAARLDARRGSGRRDYLVMLKSAVEQSGCDQRADAPSCLRATELLALSLP